MHTFIIIISIFGTNPWFAFLTPRNSREPVHLSLMRHKRMQLHPPLTMEWTSRSQCQEQVLIVIETRTPHLPQMMHTQVASGLQMSSKIQKTNPQKRRKRRRKRKRRNKKRASPKLFGTCSSGKGSRFLITTYYLHRTCHIKCSVIKFRNYVPLNEDLPNSEFIEEQIGSAKVSQFPTNTICGLLASTLYVSWSY